MHANSLTPRPQMLLPHEVTHSAQHHPLYSERLTTHDARNLLVFFIYFIDYGFGFSLLFLVTQNGGVIVHVCWQSLVEMQVAMHDLDVLDAPANMHTKSRADMHTVSPAGLDSCSESMDASTMHSSVLRLMTAPDDALNQSMCV